MDEQAKVFVGISGENSVDWLISDFAMCLQSMVTVPIHTSLVIFYFQLFIKTYSV